MQLGAFPSQELTILAPTDASANVYLFTVFGCSTFQIVFHLLRTVIHMIG